MRQLSKNRDATNLERQMRRHFADAWLFGIVEGCLAVWMMFLVFWVIPQEDDRTLSLLVVGGIGLIFWHTEHYRCDAVQDYETARRQVQQIKNRG